MSSPLPGPFMVKIPWPKHLPPAEDNTLNRKRKPQDNAQTNAAAPDSKRLKNNSNQKPRKSRDPRTHAAGRSAQASLAPRRAHLKPAQPAPVEPPQEDSAQASPPVQPFGPVTKGRRSQLKQETSVRVFRATKERKGSAPTLSSPPAEKEEAECVKAGEAGQDAERTPETPRKEDLERVVDHVQKQDKNEIFKDPVTEDVAPNYFSVISKPMDFTTVRENLAAGKYVRWELLEEDMMTMFQNAMTYNSPSTTFHKQAKTLMQVAKKLITLGKEGVTNFRGKTAGVVRAHNAQVAADDRAEKNAQKAAIRAQKMQMRNDKLIQKAAARGIRIPFGPSSSTPALGGDGSDGKSFPGPSLRENDGRRPLPLEENVRWTYRSLVPHQYPMRHWGALASGANAEGLPFAASKMIVSTFASGPVPPDAYVQSILRFAKRMDGRARDYLLMSAAECLP